MKRPLNATMCNVPMNFKFFATETVEMILHLMKDLLRLMEHLMVMLALLQQPTKAQVNQCQLILNYNLVIQRTSSITFVVIELKKN